MSTANYSSRYIYIFDDHQKYSLYQQAPRSAPCSFSKGKKKTTECCELTQVYGLVLSTKTERRWLRVVWGPAANGPYEAWSLYYTTIVVCWASSIRNFLHFLAFMLWLCDTRSRGYLLWRRGGNGYVLYILRFTSQILLLQSEKWILSTKGKTHGKTQHGISVPSWVVFTTGLESIGTESKYISL